MAEVIFHRLASAELRTAAAWYAARSRLAHGRFRKAVLEAVDRIAADPDAHARLLGPYRYVRARRFPYVLVYEIRADGSVFVVAVSHTRRRPGYWRRRK